MLISFFRMHDKTKILISPINNPQIITGDFHMIRRLALTVGCIALSAVAFSSKAHAQAAPATQDINFNGTIGSVCLFTNPVDGTLAQNNPTDEWVEGAGGIPGAGTAASAGSVTLRCTGGGQLATGVPVGTTVPAGFTPSVEQSLVYDGTNYTSASTGANFDAGLWNQPTTPLAIPVNTPVNLTVGMVAGTNGSVNSVPAGTYSYTVTLTATPN
jgi:hypothetical protein